MERQRKTGRRGERAGDRPSKRPRQGDWERKDRRGRETDRLGESDKDKQGM